jgi:hypothetical protein
MLSKSAKTFNLFFTLAGLILISSAAWAHCDGLDGPVVNAARNALESGNVNHVLIWVRSEDEAEIRAAFIETTSVRQLEPAAQALADRYFFETLVRVHRAGEGAPYTGLKPAGRDLGPAIPAADAAIVSGSDAALVQLLSEEVQHGLRAHYEEVIERKGFATDDVAGGRAYVEAYVPYIHYVESLYEAATRTAMGHFDDH